MMTEMPPRDILREIYFEGVQVEEAETYVDQVIASPEFPEGEEVDLNILLNLLTLSLPEWTAHGYGVPFDVIARWRYRGWPRKCFLCGEKIYPERYYWFAKYVDGEHQIRHIDCDRGQPLS